MLAWRCDGDGSQIKYVVMRLRSAHKSFHDALLASFKCDTSYRGRILRRAWTSLFGLYAVSSNLERDCNEVAVPKGQTTRFTPQALSARRECWENAGEMFMAPTPVRQAGPHRQHIGRYKQVDDNVRSYFVIHDSVQSHTNKHLLQRVRRAEFLAVEYPSTKPSARTDCFRLWQILGKICDSPEDHWLIRAREPRKDHVAIVGCAQAVYA